MSIELHLSEASGIFMVTFILLRVTERILLTNYKMILYKTSVITSKKEKLIGLITYIADIRQRSQQW